MGHTALAVNVLMIDVLLPQTTITKGGDTAVFHDCRPISVLPVFSRVFERILQNRLYNFFQSHSVLCDQQLGFRKGYSTDMGLLTAVD